jgi:hypothetical protein
LKDEKKKLSPKTKVEVIAKRKSNLNEVYSQTMELQKWKQIKKSSEFIYKAYEIGFSAYPNKIKL